MTYADGLPKSVIGLGGAMDIAFIGGTAYVLVTLVGPDVGGSDVDGIYRVDGPDNFAVVADIGKFAINHPPSTPFEVPSGLQYALEPYRGGFLVTDGHHNRVYRVTLDGKVVSFGPKSATATAVASGSPLLVDVEFGRGRTLYALSQGVGSGGPAGSPALPNTGALVKVNPDDTFIVVTDHLNQPTSLEFIKNTAYVVTLGGEIWKIEDVSGPPYGISQSAPALACAGPLQILSQLSVRPFAADPGRVPAGRWPENREDDAMTAEKVLAQHGVQHAVEVVELAAVAGLELAAAATLLEKESSGGHNIWGHDNVDTGGIYVKGAPVTQVAYKAYRDKRNQLGLQGVGPTQLTWSGFQDRADARGGCWDWRANCSVGFDILAGQIKALGVRGGFRAYNGSGDPAERYADDAMQKLSVWRSRLGGTPGVAAHASHALLREGDTGPAVAALQKWLNATFPAYSHIDLGPQRYGPQTVAVIAEFQRRAGVTGPDADGRIVGPRTWAALEHYGYR